MPRPAKLAVLAAVLCATIVGACNDSLASGDGDIAEADFARTATGGDPRGTYTPNTPLFAWFNLPAGFGIDLTRNGGTGTIEFAGSSATSGTYTLTDVQLDIAGSMTALGVTIPFDFSGMHQSMLGEGGGTWTVLSSDRLVLRPNAAGENADTLGYAATTRGLFLVSTDTVAPGQVTTMVVGFRR